MARRPLDKIHDHHELEMHFLHASRAWRQNKREIFNEAGSSGSFEYIGMINKSDGFQEDFDRNSILSVSGVRTGVKEHVWSKYVLDRHRLYKRAREALPEKIPKELSRIIEQTLIPVYMDGTQRPPRKCRLISS